MGVGECRNPDTPHQGRRRLSRAPSCRPDSAHSRLTRVCAVGLVTGPHARIPGAHRKRAAGPDSPPIKEGECQTPHRPQYHPGTGRETQGPGRPTLPQPTSGTARDPGRTGRGAQTTCNGPTGVLRGDLAKGARQTATEGGETRPPRVREHTNKQRTRGPYQKGNQTEHAERTDQKEWRTSRRGQGTPGLASCYKHREGRGGGAAEGGGDKKLQRPRPPKLLRALRTHQQGAASAKAVVVHSATHQPCS